MDSKLRLLASLALVVVAESPAASGRPPQDNPSAVEWFETKVRPILVDHCYTCHSADTKPAGGLRVDDRNGLLAGGNSGPAVVPGDPEASLLLEARHPPEPQTADAQGRPAAHGRADRRPDAAGSATARPGRPVKVPASLGNPNAWYEKLRREHWAWQPLTNPEAAGRAATLRGRGSHSIVSSWPSSRRPGLSRSKTPTGSLCCAGSRST